MLSIPEEQYETLLPSTTADAHTPPEATLTILGLASFRYTAPESILRDLNKGRGGKAIQAWWRTQVARDRAESSYRLCKVCHTGLASGKCIIASSFARRRDDATEVSPDTADMPTRRHADLQLVEPQQENSHVENRRQVTVTTRSPQTRSRRRRKVLPREIKHMSPPKHMHTPKSQETTEKMRSSS